MGIDEFMYYYGAQELNKMLAYEDIDLFDDEFSIGGHGASKKDEDRKEIINQFEDGTLVVGV